MKRTNQAKVQRAQSNVAKDNNQNAFTDLSMDELFLTEIDATGVTGRMQETRICVCMVLIQVRKG